MKRVQLSLLVVLGAAIAVTYYFWTKPLERQLPEGIVSGNGRIEAVEIDIATKTPGRIEEIRVDEGDFVEPGAMLARMDTEVLEAEAREAEAQLNEAKSSLDAARSGVEMRLSLKASFEAVVAQREAELNLATKKFHRAERLLSGKTISREDFDTEQAGYYGARAALSAAQANVSASDAAIATGKADVIKAEASIKASEAKIERIRAELKDSVLKSPREGRVQYRVAQPGEVLAAGGKVLNMIDVNDVFMTFFLPTAAVGRLTIGTEARVVLDAAPQYVIPAKVTYVADVAQFTPKSVETREEREKLTFRVKVTIEQEILHRYVKRVKTGLPGMAYVRVDESLPWPDWLKVHMPQ
ncbi:HlyD family efflux transporter periplasmic adaptor subunit [bacterium]|nr:HlyD family efflux transporter periplasmic adaptor subunit [bacterium]